jgi:hypothetical protein
MTKDEALRLAWEALHQIAEVSATDYEYQQWASEAITAIKAALEAKDEPVQVSPLQFVEMVMEKEHLVGKPIFWAEWPNKEKNSG